MYAGERPHALEQIFNVIDNLSCSDTRLIVTTNMTLKGMKETTDLMYKRIFDRILAKCIPVMVNDVNQREKITQSVQASLINI